MSATMTWELRAASAGDSHPLLSLRSDRMTSFGPTGEMVTVDELGELVDPGADVAVEVTAEEELPGPPSAGSRPPSSSQRSGDDDGSDEGGVGVLRWAWRDLTFGLRPQIVDDPGCRPDARLVSARPRG